MINCDPSALSAAATCFAQCIPDGMQPVVQTYLLAQLLNQLNPSFSTDPKVLAQQAAAAGFTTLFGTEGFVQAFILCNIATAVGVQ